MQDKQDRFITRLICELIYSRSISYLYFPGKDIHVPLFTVNRTIKETSYLTV